MKNFYLVCLTLISFGITAADVSVEKMSDIESRVGSMSLSELQDRRSFLIREEGQLMATQTSTQNPSTIKSVSSRLAEIRAELSALQKALLAIVGAASINALTDDGYNDNVPPVITVNGSSPVTVELGTTYSDAGATANDAFHGTTPVTSTGSVDTSVVGSYTISYSATDLDGNTATASRTVNVVDTTAPVVTVTGDNPATTELGDTYTDAGATATDASGSVTVVTSGTVDTDTVGEYTLTYTSTDASGNAGTASRTVNVVDTTAPVVTVTGDNPATSELGDEYTDAGATATDASGEIEVVTSGTVDTDTVGEYTLTYTATDASENAGTASRTVNVVDTTVPVFISQEVFVVDEGVTAIGIVEATDLAEVTYTIGETTGPAIMGNGTRSVLKIRSSGHLTFDKAPDYDVQVPDVQLYAPADAFGTVTKSTMTLSGYETGATMDFTATVTATDASGNTATQDITVSVRDVGGVDDDTGTGTGTGTGVGTGTLADGVVEIPQFISQDTFVVNEGVTAIGIVEATIGAAAGTVTITYTIGETTGPATLGRQAASILKIRPSGHLTFDRAPDYDSQVPDTTLWDTSLRNANCPQTNGSEICYETERTKTLSGYESGATMDFTATVTATSSIGTVNTQDITVQVRDVGGVDDDTGTGTGTGTGVGTGTGTATNPSDTTGNTGGGIVRGG